MRRGESKNSVQGATLRDVAREAKVSVASASRALNHMDNVAPAVRARVLAVAAKLRYVPHGGARSLVTSRTQTIGVLLPAIYGEFFAEIMRGMDVAARAKGLHLLISGSHHDVNEAVAEVRSMGGRVDGLLVMSPFVNSRDLAEVLPLNLPVVTIASRIGKVEQGSISVDNFGGAQTAVQHLYDKGCRTIAHIAGPATNFEAQERKRGYEAALAELCPGQKPILHTGDFNEPSGYSGIKAILDAGHRPDGVFVANDMMAVGCLLALREIGLNVPQDIAVVGFDDIPIARFASPTLTTLRVGVFDLGRRGVELLLHALEPGPHEHVEGIVVAPDLIFRGSTDRQTVAAAEAK